MSLFRFELKKLLFNKKTLIILGVLFVLYAVVGVISTYYIFGGRSNYAVYQELADPHVGPIDAEQAAVSTEISDEIKERYGNNNEALSEAGYDDPVLKFNLLYADYARYADEYYNGSPFDSANKPYGINDLQDKVNSMEQTGDTASFEYRKTVQQLDTQISLGEPVFATTALWNNLFTLWGGIMPILLLFIPLAFIIAPVFSVEASTGMDNLVLSSKHGRKKIVTAKLSSVIVTSVTVTVIYLIATFLGNFLTMGSFTGVTAALRSVAAFVRSPFAMSVWQYAIVSAAWLLFMSVIFGIVTTFISSKMKSQMATFGIGLVVLLSTIVLGALGSNFPAVIKSILDFSFSSVFQSANIFSTFTVYNMFGITVSYWAAAIGVMTILCGIGTWAIYRFQKTRIAA